jgi:hypothetical protein
MDELMVLVLVVENAGGGVAVAMWCLFNHLYVALGQEGYHPRCWRQAMTVIIPKPNKPDYSDPKAYQPIALLNCLGKILEKLMAM